MQYKSSGSSSQRYRNQTINEIEQIQEKAIRIMSFKPKNEPTNPLFRNLKIIKFRDILAYNNCIFVHDQLNENLPKSFNKFFTTAPAQHNYNTRQRQLQQYHYKINNTFSNLWTKLFKSIKHRAASDWNAMIRDINTIGMAGNKCNRVKGHGIIYPNDVIKKLIYNIKNIA